ncbi:D-glycero-alpha-D-manno-heptose-1,7-bisphosphate 7-phosphatase [Bacillus sp. FJAT-45350]|uniref:D-glycero-alpha-D-manno-heptose-1,7-bisphosphate 7-phosphatase n=1 Tax=Bacillus sp. FJAT-45350 TaxID=2011014 RepID=UPI000BB699C3|nr:HAD family hydrolase [Bacillus sp. FJAT-45350]
MNKAVFLDRDGVINEVLSSRVKFVNKPKDLYLLEGVGEAVKVINEAGYKVFVVTNQGGVGLGFMKEHTLQKVHEKMIEDIRNEGGRIDDVAYCPHNPHAGCACRKPEAQMLLNLAEKHQIDLSKSYMVGDREPDIEAGKKAGVKETIFIGDEKTSYGADKAFPSLLEAAKSIFKESC